ncbi:elongation factor 1-alpha C-terminal domain-related protein, partial [Neisseria weixii]|uniref:elongation factor 1-alpha C-terminal domain-related protein n=1 Tax=Neisseria weixii TaxID=1853276 RepID=UPI0040398353
SELKLNDIGHISFKTQQPLNATTYEQNQATGAFILIDEATNHTVAAGMIRGGDEAGNFEI